MESTFGLWEVHFPLAEVERETPVVHLRHRLLVDREYLRGQRWQLTLAVTYRATAEGPWEQRRLPPESTLVLAARLPSPLPPDPFAP
ncbi:MAG: hypothetical protein JSR82_23360 [Verrucomicrobia bacterium]|nr:hypothetical protein [Verrucomicrobiota bacterium]